MYPLRGCYFRMGAFLAGTQARDSLNAKGIPHSAECGKGRCPLPPQAFEKA